MAPMRFADVHEEDDLAHVCEMFFLRSDFSSQDMPVYCRSLVALCPCPFVKRILFETCVGFLSVFIVGMLLGFDFLLFI